MLQGIAVVPRIPTSDIYAKLCAQDQLPAYVSRPYGAVLMRSARLLSQNLSVIQCLPSLWHGWTGNAPGICWRQCYRIPATMSITIFHQLLEPCGTCPDGARPRAVRSVHDS